MHPQITERRRKFCGDFVRALEECHAQGLATTFTGACESVAIELNMCLRRERLERQSDHIRESQIKRKAIEQRWKEMEEEEFGPGGKLKEVLALPARPASKPETSSE